MRTRKNFFKLAKLIYELTKEMDWIADSSTFNSRWPWILNKNNIIGYWTLSPEVNLYNYKFRLCITSQNMDSHTVIIFVDDEIKHPGGLEKINHFPWPKFMHSWSRKLARQLREDGGKNGPINVSKLVIDSAISKLNNKLPDNSDKIGLLSIIDRDKND